MNIELKKHDTRPIYYQIFDQIRSQIESGLLPPGSQIPTEREVSDKTGVSRDTVRKAIKALTMEGYCQKIVGKGIFVSQGRMPINIVTPQGTTKFVENLGYELTSAILAKEILPFDFKTRLTKELDIAQGETMLKISRIRKIKNGPSLYEDSFLSLRRFPGLEDQPVERSLYDVLGNFYGTVPHHAKAELQIRAANEEEARLLDVALSTALLVKEAIVFSRDDQFVEYVRSLYPGDRFTFIVDPTVPGTGGQTKQP